MQPVDSVHLIPSAGVKVQVKCLDAVITNDMHLLMSAIITLCSQLKHLYLNCDLSFMMMILLLLLHYYYSILLFCSRSN